ncbi:hypothetical protein HK405_014007, partial [Cladochytrium tenue]
MHSVPDHQSPEAALPDGVAGAAASIAAGTAATPAASGSRTVTVAVDADAASPPVAGVLRLRAVALASPPSERRIQWADSVEDNEGLGRKSSK